MGNRPVLVFLVAFDFNDKEEGTGGEEGIDLRIMCAVLRGR